MRWRLTERRATPASAAEGLGVGADQVELTLGGVQPGRVDALHLPTPQAPELDVLDVAAAAGGHLLGGLPAALDGERAEGGGVVDRGRGQQHDGAAALGGRPGTQLAHQAFHALGVGPLVLGRVENIDWGVGVVEGFPVADADDDHVGIVLPDERLPAVPPALAQRGGIVAPAASEGDLLLLGAVTVSVAPVGGQRPCQLVAQHQRAQLGGGLDRLDGLDGRGGGLLIAGVGLLEGLLGAGRAGDQGDGDKDRGHRDADEFEPDRHAPFPDGDLDQQQAEHCRTDRETEAEDVQGRQAEAGALRGERQDDRPVPQVQPVGDAPKEPKGAQGERPVEGGSLAGHGGHDHRGAQHGDDEEAALIEQRRGHVGHSGDEEHRCGAPSDRHQPLGW